MGNAMKQLRDGSPDSLDALEIAIFRGWLSWGGVRNVSDGLEGTHVGLLAHAWDMTARGNYSSTNLSIIAASGSTGQRYVGRLMEIAAGTMRPPSGVAVASYGCDGCLPEVTVVGHRDDRPTTISWNPGRLGPNAPGIAGSGLLVECAWLNPTGGAIRGRDNHGEGHFGASRKYGPHVGADYSGTGGQDVLAVTDGTIRIGHPYAEDLSFKYLAITTSDGITARMLYVLPAVGIHNGSDVAAGQPVGTLQSLQALFPGITDHVHVDIWYQGAYQNPADLIY